MRKGIPLVLVSALVVACAHPAEFVYPPRERPVREVAEEPTFGLRVAVLPFEEVRDERNTAKAFWLCFMPLAPFGYVEYERPETAGIFNSISGFTFDVSRDMAEAVVTSLEGSGLFAHVYLASEAQAGDADLIVEGRVTRTFYRGRTFTYCLSVAGAVFWVLGLPVGDSTDELAFDLEVRDNGTGKHIWGCRSQNSKRILQGFYYGWGEDVQGYAELMEGAMREIVQKLARGLENYERRRRVRPAP